ncbi:non-ribosomal peptide synthetase [Pseudomonas mucidolens]|uniref:Non-ribosomal peptide synthase domain TIGR01720/amino acid adenylation domain-containing protein n=1 Tax=Pseudomonas mucidolens TaxID=46679 RepID=A0A1H2MZA8_9PSED|nr:non-ribosomal peptide synthetase [Pseudomonas mucidolens]SDU98318.1 non-ribosomal peptide synthase domain TIGR01720/amino acid adenylation domain-containing protein [Pseudomonas mucidolens]SQH32964.1 putative non-ribosomal peptide synthetase [Pseudomonas mucidolens]
MDKTTAERIAKRFIGLGLEQRRQILAKMNEANNSFKLLPIVTCRHDVPRIPLSFAQQRLLFLWQMEPQSSFYNVPRAVRLKGELNETTLRQAFDALVQRHEVLRTRFVSEDGAFYQEIHDSAPVNLHRIDVPTAALDAGEAGLKALVAEELAQPFDLINGPLLRVKLYRLEAHEHVLVVTLHHIVSDGWSSQLMVEEFVHLYDAIAHQREPRLPALPIQYADFALWQRSWMEAGESARQLQYWTQKLGDEQPLLALPLDRERPPVPSYRGAVLTADCSPVLSQALKNLGSARGYTLFMLVLAAFSVVLARQSGQRDIRLGAPNAGRNRSETEGLIGFFINTQVLRVEVDEQQSFEQLLAQVKETVFGAQAHQDLPFEQLVDALAPERNLSHNPLFQVKINQNLAGSGLSHNGQGSFSALDIEVFEIAESDARFDLALDFTDTEHGLQISFSYATDLFERRTVEAIADSLQGVLQDMVAAPAALIDQRPAVAGVADEAPTEDFPHPHFLALWQANGQTRGAAVAVRCEQELISFAALEQQSNRLARHLREQGLRNGEVVALALERSVAWTVGLLAVLKAGGVYLPLDVQQPAERLQQVVSRSGAAWLLRTAGDQRIDCQCRVLDYDEARFASCSAAPLALEVAPEQPAYLIFTSGSTGQPKGVLVSHQALGNYVQAILQRLRLPTDASLAMISTLAADLGHTMLFAALASGRLLHLVPQAYAFDPDRFAGYMSEHRVGALKIVPSHLHSLLQAGNPADVLPAHALVLGGETCSWSLVQQVAQLAPDCRIINHYGPTETTVGVLTHEVTDERPATLSVPVGQPLANTRARLLDAYLNPVAARVAGELYLGGAGVAQGYLNQPGLTAERFVPDPQGCKGERVYRSGDRARSVDGVLEFLGRGDDQVKIRGYRIEPGEVRHMLRQLDDIQDAAVLALPMEGDAGRLQLVAYCVPAPTATTDAEQLTRELRGLLPDYMVPARIILLERLPLTANGKLDHRALPAPDAQVQDYVAPSNELEQVLAEVWAQVLKLEQVGTGDNFFELGGDSILSLQIIARAKRRGIKLTPKQLFEKQTIAQLAQVAKWVEVKAPATPASALQINGAQALLPIQARFFGMDIPERHHWNQSILLHPQARLEVAALNLALQALYAQHDALRLAFTRQDGQWRADYQARMPGELLWTPAALATADEVQALADQAQRSLNLEQGVLLRAVLMELPEGQQRLLLVIHHTVVDGVSWRVLLEDLQSAYTQATRGEPVKLSDKGASLQTWAERLQGHAQSDVLKAELRYWQDCLQGCALDLPRDNPDGGLSLSQAHVVSTRLDRGLTHKLLKVAPAAYRTQVNDLLLTALARVLCRWSQQSAVAIQLEGHGREALFDEQDISRTMGWFTSLFPVKLTPAADLDASIKQIKEQLRQLPNKGIGYGLLRYCGDAASQAALADLGEPRITFNYLGQFDADFAADQGALFMPAPESDGAARSERGELSNWLSINGQVYGAELELSWTFSTGMYQRNTVQALADDYAAELAALIEHCSSAQQSGVTPSDFNLVNFTQAQLERLPVNPRDIADLYPLSPMQQGILFHTLHEPDGPAYTNQLRVDVQQLDAERFRAAWQQTLDAHDILRTAFVWPPEMSAPVQIVLGSVPMPLVIHDWQGRANLEQALDQLAAEDLDAGFQLDRAPLLRVILVRTGASTYHLIYTSHHILMDGWSTSQLFGEVLQRYAGQAPAAAQGHYRDYIEWLSQRDAEVSQGFWRGALGHLQEPTRLADAVGPQQVLGSGYADHEHLFSAELTARLNGFAREQKITLNTLMQSAWLLLLQRYTGQATVAFGATVAGRPMDLPGVEQQIGLFINTLPVVATPSPHLTVTQWLQQVQDLNLALREHEHTPLYEIQSWAGLGAGPLFDSILVFENYPMSEALQQGQGSGLGFSPIRRQEQTNYPLTLVAVAGRELALGCSFDQACFDAAGVQRLAEQLEHLMRQFMADAGQPLGVLELLPPDQRQAALAWGRSPSRAPATAGVVEQIEAQVRHDPQALAMLFGEEQLDYATLDARANQLAHKLRALGVGPEVRVGVCLRRTPQMVISLLAILKAGGAYVPLDPEYPQERLLHMLDDSQAAVVLAEASLREVLPAVLQAQVLLVESDAQWLHDWPHTCPAPLTCAANLAYVIYTSGSTGKPKGVAITHGNVAALVQWSLATYSREALQGVLASTSICFDLSVWEIFVTLAGGGFMVLADNALALPELPARERVRLINTVPSAIAALQRARQIPPSVQTINLAGEPLKQALVDSLYASTAVERIYDLYGPSEDTTYSTFTLRVAGGQANIGRPLENTTAYLLDPQLQALPAGVATELYLAGAGVTRGYLMRPGLTAERYVPDPFSTRGERLYRSGDLVRQGAEGDIEYIGRADHQVKIRGFRIELSEVEARLLMHPAVREAVVLTQEGAAGKQLLAYVVAEPEDGEQPNLVDSLRSHLAASLPAHMVPSHLHLIEALPLTPNGKLDRKGLLALGGNPRQLAYEAPRTDLQWEVATLWQEVLDVQRVGLNDSFFHLGGHSLLATLVVTRIKERLGDQVPLRELFAAHTLEQFCDRIQALRADLSPVQDELAKSLETLKRLSLDDLEKLIS